MRSLSINATLAVLGSILLMTPAYATDLEDLQKKVGKVAVHITNGSKPKAYCTCPNFILGKAIAGRLIQTTHVSGPNTFVNVICELNGFDAQGASVGLASCDDFTVLK
jgi:hypothetical protein